MAASPLVVAAESALQLAARHDDPRDLDGVLYRYGRLPVDARARRRWPDRAAVAAWLGLDDAPWLRGWAKVPAQHSGGWHQWRSLSGADRIDRSRPVLKLYVSPAVAALPHTVAELARAAAGCGVPAFKVASDVEALHRPDKLVAYLTGREQLRELVAVLRPHLAGVAAHGVPFTASLADLEPGPSGAHASDQYADDGLLSWAADPVPPSGPAAPGGTDGSHTPDGTHSPGRLSWRQRVCAVLAEGMTGPGDDGRPIGDHPQSRVEAALARAESAGIDTRRWAPR